MNVREIIVNDDIGSRILVRDRAPLPPQNAMVGGHIFDILRFHFAINFLTQAAVKMANVAYVTLSNEKKQQQPD